MNKLLENFTDFFTYGWMTRFAKEVWFQTRMMWQRIWSTDHLCDHDAWECGYILARKVYPYVLRFKNSERHGHPCLEGFYDNKTNEEKVEGACSAEWERILKEIVFALEWTLLDNGSSRLSKKLERKFKKVYGNWEAEIPENKKNFNFMVDLDKEERERVYYFDDKMYWKLAERAQEGMKLFGKYMLNMWD